MRAFGLAAALIVAGCVEQADVGRANFEAYCADCHGVTGQGGGALAASLGLSPPDLTAISARNSGTFPLAQVMSVIDGYTRADQHGSRMPEFGPLLEGPTVLVDFGDGTTTPTPAPLVALAEYLESIQK